VIRQNSFYTPVQDNHQIDQAGGIQLRALGDLVSSQHGCECFFGGFLFR